jgi:uncharacterized protein (TIGR02246 family)
MVTALLVLLVLAPGAAQEPSAQDEVRQAERAFARTMADRDLKAFASHVAEDGIFLGPDGSVLRGRQQVVEGWRKYFEGPRAPFSWEPERVEVVASGTLAVSTGPVFDPSGGRVGTFTSTWRRDPDGRWRVVLDSGCPPCKCP